MDVIKLQLCSLSLFAATATKSCFQNSDPHNEINSERKTNLNYACGERNVTYNHSIIILLLLETSLLGTNDVKHTLLIKFALVKCVMVILVTICV